MITRVLVTTGAVLVISGLALGFAPIRLGDVSCGSTFRDGSYVDQLTATMGPDGSLLAADGIKVVCAAARSSRELPVWMLLTVGLAAVGGGVAARYPTGQRATRGEDHGDGGGKHVPPIPW